jgi:hypothetical protein
MSKIVIGMAAALVITGVAACTKSEEPKKPAPPAATAPKPDTNPPSEKPAEKPAMEKPATPPPAAKPAEPAKPADPAKPGDPAKPATPKPETDADET